MSKRPSSIPDNPPSVLTRNSDFTRESQVAQPIYALLWILLRCLSMCVNRMYEPGT
jgi:hypothetical protein